MSEDYICDDDEIIIQATVNEQPEEASNRYSSAIDPYTVITYGDLSDEKRLVTDLKCIAHASQLKKLIGQKCHFPNCDQEIPESTIVTHECGYAIKLVWECAGGHRYSDTCNSTLRTPLYLVFCFG